MTLPDAFHDAEDAMIHLKKMAPDTETAIALQYILNRLRRVVENSFGRDEDDNSEPEIPLPTEAPKHSRMFK